MMLHRHFEGEKVSENLTKLADLTRTEEKAEERYVSEVFPPEKPAEKPKRKKKQTEKQE